MSLTASDAPVAARMRELEDEIRRLSHAYYVLNQPEVSDEVFDAIWQQLETLEAEHPDLMSADSPTVKLYEGDMDDAALAAFEEVAHRVAMLSLGKARETAELAKFAERFPGQRFAVMPKFDGVSLSLTYENGELVRAVTRGDGRKGKDITRNVKDVTVGVPSRLAEAVSVEVRGEAVMHRSDFAAYNEAHPDDQLKNPRNGASGTLVSKTRDADRITNFYAFDVLDDASGAPMDERLRALGFQVPFFEYADDADGIVALVERLREHRAGFDYDTDGAVIRVADRAAFEAAGANGHHPRGAVAFKYPSEKVTTRLLDVKFAVGPMGMISITGVVEPVLTGGTTIENVSLHNPADIARKNIRVGDVIWIMRANDVIPFTPGPVDPDARDGSEREIEFPQACPSCGGPVSIEGESQIMRCNNIAGCPEQQTRRLVLWASRKSADIDAIGPTWIEKLAADGVLRRVSDFYRLDRDTLLRFERMGDRLADKFLASIQASKQVGLRNALVGLAIRHASEGTAKRLCLAGYETIEQVAAASEEDLVQIPDIGPTVARSLVSYFQRDDIRQEIADLRSLGVSLDVVDEDRPVQAPADSQLLGKKVVITGTLSVDRKEMTKLLEAAGAKVSGSVSKSTDYLVCGENAGSKEDKARSLGVTVLTEQQARELLA